MKIRMISYEDYGTLVGIIKSPVYVTVIIDGKSNVYGININDVVYTPTDRVRLGDFVDFPKRTKSYTKTWYNKRANEK